MQIDETDRKLLDLLRENARMPVADLARRIGLARTTVQTRIERLEYSGGIAGYTLRKSPLTSPLLRATVLVSVDPRSTAQVLARLKTLSGVEAVHTTSGRFDMLVQATASATEELDETLDLIGEVSGVRSSESLIHLSTRFDRSV